MSIRLRTLQNRKNVFDVYIQSRNIHGKRIQLRKHGVKNLAEAKKLEKEFKIKVLLKKNKPAEITWIKFMEIYHEYLKVKYRPSTVESSVKTIQKWATPIFRSLNIDEITEQEIHDLLFLRMEKIKPSTKKWVLGVLRKAFQIAIDKGFIDKNPCQGIKVKVPESKQFVLNATEAQKLLTEAKFLNHEFYSIWATALFTGMRSGELYALKWSDIDLENERISVTRSWCSKAGYGPTKSRKNRVVPVCSSLMQLLRELKLQRSTDAFVLPRLWKWTKGEQARELKKFCKAIGITPVKFHDLRATFITQMLLKGVSLAQVMAIVGHAELETTTRYLRIAGADLNGATEKLSYSLPSEKLAQVIELGAQ